MFKARSISEIFIISRNRGSEIEYRIVVNVENKMAHILGRKFKIFQEKDVSHI